MYRVLNTNKTALTYIIYNYLILHIREIVKSICTYKYIFEKYLVHKNQINSNKTIEYYIIYS